MDFLVASDLKRPFLQHNFCLEAGMQPEQTMSAGKEDNWPVDAPPTNAFFLRC